MLRSGLTDKQQRVLDLLRQDDRLSLDEIAAALGRSKSATYLHIRALERKGYISRRPGIPRSIRVVKQEE